MKAKLLYLFYTLILISCIAVICSDLLVQRNSKTFLYDSTGEISYNKVGLVLGTAKYLNDGSTNLYYQYRIDAASELYKSGKVKYLIVSGDNSRKDYDEPSMMKQDLIAEGVPSEAIYLDYAGFRTLDSVVRSKAIFGQDSITIISQPFHNERAICLAQKNGIYAVGYNAENVYKMAGMKTDLRERFARIKMVGDMFFGVQPKFLGDTIVIPD